MGGREKWGRWEEKGGKEGGKEGERGLLCGLWSLESRLSVLDFVLKQT